MGILPSTRHSMSLQVPLLDNFCNSDAKKACISAMQLQVSTKDGVLILRHDLTLDDSTDVATRPEFAGRK